MINLVVSQVLPKPLESVLSGLKLPVLAEPAKALQPINDAFEQLFNRGSQFPHLPYFPPRPVCCCPERPFPLNPSKDLEGVLGQIQNSLQQVLSRLDQGSGLGNIGDLLKQIAETLSKGGVRSPLAFPGSSSAVGGSRISDGTSNSIFTGDSSLNLDNVDQAMKNAEQLMTSDKVSDQIQGQLQFQRALRLVEAISTAVQKQGELQKSIIQKAV